jgi:hypothetical protein
MKRGPLANIYVELTVRSNSAIEAILWLFFVYTSHLTRMLARIVDQQIKREDSHANRSTSVIIVANTSFRVLQSDHHRI